MQHAGRWTEAGQEMDHTACRQTDRKGKQEMDHAAYRQMYRGRTGDGLCSMPADGQGQGSRWIMQHAGRCTEAGQEMDRAACWQMDRGRAADGSCSVPPDVQMCREGFFILPYNELAIAQGPKIHQKKEL